MGRCFEALHLPEQADRAYQDALREAPEDFGVIAYAADFYRRADRFDDAKRLYERLLDPALAVPADASAQARRHLAVLLGERGATSQATALLDENRTNQADTLADQRIRLYLQSLTPSARANALAQFLDTRRMQLLSPDERLLLAEMLASAGRLGEARAQLAELEGEHPNTPRVLVRYARLLIRMEDVEEAQRLATRLEALEPNSARVLEVRLALPGAKSR
jgi:tetratricopeptide (TPR) repeat protein